MSKQITINSSFYKKMDMMKDYAELKTKDRLEAIARYAVDISPVDTAAYVESFSFVQAGAGGGRSRNSNNKPTGQNVQAARDTSYGVLLGDINALDLDAVPNATLRNRSPHAREVEDGRKVEGSNWRREGYGVFRSIKSHFRDS